MDDDNEGLSVYHSSIDELLKSVHGLPDDKLKPMASSFLARSFSVRENEESDSVGFESDEEEEDQRSAKKASASVGPRPSADDEENDDGDDLESPRQGVLRQESDMYFKESGECEGFEVLELKDVMDDVQNIEVSSRKLNILLMTIGSRGDIQPFICLAQGLMAKGHHVRLATFECFRAFIESFGVEFFPLKGDPKALMELCANNTMFSLSFMYKGLMNFRGFYKDLCDSSYAACVTPSASGRVFYPDVIISNPPVMTHYHLASAFNVPVFIVFTMPWTKTAEFPHPMVADRGWGSKEYNKLTFKLLEKTTWIGLSDIINDWRVNTLKLAPLSVNLGSHWLYVRDVPHIYCFSPKLFPPPRDWDHLSITTTNFFFLNESVQQKYEPPIPLKEFIEGGTAPVYIGFGSVPASNPDELTDMIVRAAEKTGVRLIVSKGWGGVKEIKSNPNIYFIEQCPHDWLFPQLAAVIHHGGAGTLSTGLRYCKPTGVIAFFGDQFYWGHIVQQCGAGLFTPHKALTFEWLASALTRLTTDESIITKAAEIGEAINSTDGVELTVDAILKLLPVENPRTHGKKRSYSVEKLNSSGQWEDFSDFQNLKLEHGWRWTSNWTSSPTAEYSASNEPNDYHPMKRNEDVFKRTKWTRGYVRADVRCDCPLPACVTSHH